LHDGVVGHGYNRIFLQRSEPDMLHTIHACMQCEDHPCYEKCPKKERAMVIDENGVVYINEDECIGCGLCAKACPYTPSRINMVKSSDRKLRKAKKCDLCRTRPEGPACIEWCPVRCIGMSDEPVPVYGDNENEEAGGTAPSGEELTDELAYGVA
jgi:Fe-S-cluster-containing hydrogenase component 2